MHSPFDWRRGPRSTFSLGHEAGVYALFLREGSTLPGIEAGEQRLLYIGLTANRKGLAGRCHFDARTRNHSPRKSLAVLLMEPLQLTPLLVTKPNSPDTWGLEASSEARLSAWMQDHLDLATEVCADPHARETELVERYAPPLNLAKCAQSPHHRRISAARAGVMARLQGALASRQSKSPSPHGEATSDTIHAKGASAPPERETKSPRKFVGSDTDTAEAIAARYGLMAKSYRQRLRETISWYRKPQDWTFPVDSAEWRDMIAVAKKMTLRSR